jgi:hypothetical protein
MLLASRTTCSSRSNGTGASSGATLATSNRILFDPMLTPAHFPIAVCSSTVNSEQWAVNSGRCET